jgi:hypothetical protein
VFVSSPKREAVPVDAFNQRSDRVSVAYSYELEGGRPTWRKA